MTKSTRQVYNLEQIYVQIGENYAEIQSTLQLPLLDPSSSLDEDYIFRLGLITAFQYAESLPDSAAVQAATDRRDWRYALHLPANHPGPTAPLLCKFRASLYFSAQADHEFEQLLSCLGKIGLFSFQRDGQDVDRVISRVCSVTHIMRMKQAIKTALSCLAASNPDWLRTNAMPHWYEYYKTKTLDQPVELSELDMQKEAVRMGRDMHYMLNNLNRLYPTGTVEQPEIRAIAKLWESEFMVSGDLVSWRAPKRSTCNCAGLGLNRTRYSS